MKASTVTYLGAVLFFLIGFIIGFVKANGLPWYIPVMGGSIFIVGGALQASAGAILLALEKLERELKEVA